MMRPIFQIRFFLTIFLFFTTVTAVAQVDSVSLKEAMSNLDKALVNKDEQALMQLLNEDVSYGHSNGWVQNKTEIINDLKSGKLTYTKIENESVLIAAINKQWATVRTNTNAEGKAPNGNAFQMRLHILEVWLKTKKGWQLIARQGTKL
ncbi:MAG: nuclear transport factor 2 family protein [Chitinophagales bacterium]